MSSPIGIGGMKPESRESRILGSITAESYDYRDQAKFMIKVANDNAYMAAYMRKMQRGIDAANENFIQQIQSLINDLLVLFAGNGDTGLDFGDLKYIFQALGALFGFGEAGFPLNLFEAAWHFFATYILPINNFEEVINLIIDGAIATILDLFGEIPIVGEALQQLAVIIRNTVDGVLWIFEAIGNLLEAIFGSGSLEDFLDNVWDAVLWIPRMIGNLIKNGLLGIKSALDALNIFGKIQPNNIDRVPLQSLFSGRVNALDAPTFSSLDSLGPLGEFVYDPDVSFKGNDGSAKCICDGFDHELYSNEMAVDEKTEVNLEVQVKYSGVVSPSSPIKLRLALFTEGVEKEIVDIDTVATGGSGGWLELRGEYRIPEEVDEVRMTLFVSGDATAGTVWFAKPDMNKNYITGIAPIDWIIDLPEALSGLDEFIQWIVDSFMEAIDGIFGDGTPLGEFLETFLGWVDDVFVTMAEAADALWQALGLNKIFTRIFGGAESNELVDADDAVKALNGRIVALEGGGVLTTYTVNTVWPNPTPTEHKRIKVIVFCGGDGGGRPSTNFRDQAKGGNNGGYVEVWLWTDEIPSSVSITIGAAGAGATFGGGDGSVGSVSSFGSIVIGRKGVGAVSTDGAYEPKGIPPGDGGRGGFCETTDGFLLASSEGVGGAFALGGRSGFGTSGTDIDGKNGESAPTGVISGGGGGGGGSVGNTTAGNGGNGGWPGGGGGAAAKMNGNYGNGGNGGHGGVQIVTDFE